MKEKRLAKGNEKERSILPDPGGVGMKNNNFTSVIRKPHRGRAGLKRDASIGERLRFHHHISVRLATVAHYKRPKQADWSVKWNVNPTAAEFEKATNYN